MAISVNISGDYEILSDGLHVATISSVDEAYFPYYEATQEERSSLKSLTPGSKEFQAAVKAKKLVRKVVLTWFTDEADSQGNTKEKKQFLTASLHKKATLRDVVSQLLEPGEELNDIAANMDILRGRKARLFVKHEENASTGEIKDKITQVVRFKAPTAKPQAPLGGRAAAAAVLAPAKAIGDDDIPF